MITLTARQKQAYDFITGYCAENGFGPSYDEICAGIGLKSKSNVHRLVYGLAERGVLIKHAGMARGYSFPSQDKRAA